MRCEPTVEAAHLCKQPCEGFLLTCLVDVVHALSLTVALSDLCIFDATDIRYHMVDVAGVLLGNLTIEFLQVVVSLALLHGPVLEVLHQNLHVADTIVAGFDMVVSKVLGQVGWVYST